MTQVFRCHSTFYIKKIIGVFCGISALIVFPNLARHINTPDFVKMGRPITAELSNKTTGEI
jgi:hypothetical protein